jgi:hypothetical protein
MSTPKKVAVRLTDLELSATLRALNVAKRCDNLTPAMESARDKYRELRERMSRAGHPTGTLVGGDGE